MGEQPISGNRPLLVETTPSQYTCHANAIDYLQVSQSNIKCLHHKPSHCYQLSDVQGNWRLAQTQVLGSEAIIQFSAPITVGPILPSTLQPLKVPN